nr:hypothetical protein CFP56_46771 [Quercus suber]
MSSMKILMTMFGLATPVILANVPDPSCAPGGNFDLSKWELQLPTGNQGNPDTVSSSQLEGCSGYQDPSHQYFFTETGDGALVMKVPGDPATTGCVTTSGSQHCRTEFRETDPSSWSTTASKNRLYVDLVGESGSSVCIGQAFQADGISKPVAEIYYSSGGDIEVGVERVATGGSQMRYPVGNVARGTRFSYELRYEGGHLGISINGGDLQNLQLFFDTSDAYFKAGNYNQGDDASDIHLFQLIVTHEE